MMPDWTRELWPYLWPVVFLVAYVWWRTWQMKQFEDEFRRNAELDPPDDRQVRWHIRHIREDVALLCHLVAALIAITLWFELRK
jgi:hypothetical protein